MNLDGVQVTDKKEITKYFKKQHTAFPSDKKWNLADISEVELSTIVPNCFK